MCGIVGYTGRFRAIEVLAEGIARVLYRGYDSAGVAILDGGRLAIVKHAGRPETTVEEARRLELAGQSGIAHTRWATHGDITDLNAHPHTSCDGQIAVVHNGQLWNYHAFRRELEDEGCTFRTEVDSEVIAHLLERFRKRGDDLPTAARKTAALLRGGAFAFAAIDATSPGRIVGACYGAPLYLGIGDQNLFLASDHRAFRTYTERYVALRDGQVADLNENGRYQLTTFDNEAVAADVERLWYELSDISREPYQYFMEAEINHQGRMLDAILDGRVTDDGRIRLGGLERNPALTEFIRTQLGQIVFTGCGTSYFACQALEREAFRLGLNARALNAGELVTMPFNLNAEILVVPVSQSGITAEVLDVAAQAEQRGAVVWPICNTPASSLTRFGRGSGMYLQAGPETAVASTKAFTATVLNGGLLLHAIARLRSLISNVEVAEFCRACRTLRGQINGLLARSSEFQDLGSLQAQTAFFQFLGKGYALPIAEEAALKVKEISYRRAAGTSASDLKHGTLATLDEDMLVIGICLDEPVFPKIYQWTHDNLSQVLSRGGRVIVVAAEGDQTFDRMSVGPTAIHSVIHVPTTPYGLLTAVLAVIPLQFFALGLAKALGNDIDRPRHIAKASSVP